MIIKSSSSINNVNFQALLISQTIPTSRNIIELKYDSWPNKDANFNHTIQAVIIFIDKTEKNKFLQFNFLRFDRYWYESY